MLSYNVSLINKLVISNFNLKVERVLLDLLQNTWVTKWFSQSEYLPRASVLFPVGPPSHSLPTTVSSAADDSNP